MDNGASSYRRFRVEGDKNAFVEIIRDYKDGLIFYLVSIVGNIGLAEELAEDTFFLLATRKPRDKESASFKTWLYTIGRNVALDYLRKKSKHGEVPIDEYETIVREMNQVEAEYLKKERQIMVHKAMQTLSAEYRQALWLVFFEEMNIEEAERVMKKGHRSFEAILYRAKKQLRTQLESEGFIYEEL